MHTGDKLDSEQFYTGNLTSQEYSECATMIIPGGFAIIKPDTIPTLIKTIQVPPIIYSAQMDQNGLVWVAPPYNQEDDNSERIYIIDPVTERVVKSITLPQELRTPSCLKISGNKVYFRGDRNGFSVGIGAIDRLTYNNIEAIAKFDTTGFASSPGLEIINNNILAFCETNGRQSSKIVLFNPVTKTIITKVIGNYYRYTYDLNYIYLTVQTAENQIILQKIDPSNLNLLTEVLLGGDEIYITSNQNNICVGSFANKYIKIVEKSNLTILKTIDFSKQPGIYFNRSFGFITQRMLMLNDNSFYDMQNDIIHSKLFPINYPQTMNLTLAEGQTLK
ncbi:MAG TPA: hypothetical protein PKW10_13330 [Saprospiraceae bacterium]|nr:hypothetical protein [Saprospiraceae bacterium]